MNELSRLSKEDLRIILDETEGHISEIRQELERRERREQHEAIEELELQFERAKVNWSEVRAFFQQVLDELRGRDR
jgi:hypothetical protein